MHPRLTHKKHPSGILVLIGSWLVLGVLFSSLAPQWAGCDDTADPTSSSWRINADSVQYDPGTNEYTAEGHVRLTRQGRTLTADRMTLNQTRRIARASGHVQLAAGDDLLNGERLEWHLDRETGTLVDGTMFFSQNHLYLKGAEIQKTGPETYLLKKAQATACDGPDPAWRLTSSDLEVTIEGYGKAIHAAFWARQVPVIYTPYLIFPVKLKRQTGLLMPEPAFSDRKGIEYLQPFFWAINDHMDATIIADYMERRGTRWGIEHRYLASQRSFGTWMAEGFEDRQVDDGQGENTQDWGYEEDAALRPNRDRYWFRGKFNQDLPGKVTAKLDLDLVSDQDYLKEFQDGYMGFDYTRSYYLDTFGRDIEDYTNPIRLNQLNLNRLWSGYTLNTDVRWYDNVIKRRQSDTDDTLQQLPAVTLDGSKKKIFGSPVYFDLLSGYTHFYRQDGIRGQRGDLYPRIYYPVRLLDAFSLEPSAGIRQTFWHIDHDPASSLGDDTEFQRSIYDLRLDTSTELFRVFNFTTAGCDRLKHTIKPRVVYEYIPEQDQADLPQFDEDDRIEAQNRITYSLTNTLVARKTPQTAEGQAPAQPVYMPFLRFKLEQSFHIDQYNDGYDRPFSYLLAELDLTPTRYVYIDADALWSPYDSEFYGYNAAARLWDARGDSIGINYRYTRETAQDEYYDEVTGVQSITVTGTVQVTSHWRLRCGYERDIESSQLIERGVGISYLAQCWGLDLDYKEEIENRSIIVKLHLMGLGSVGQ